MIYKVITYHLHMSICTCFYIDSEPKMEKKISGDVKKQNDLCRCDGMKEELNAL